MSSTPDTPSTPPAADAKPRVSTAAYLSVVTLVVLGTALFATAAIVKLRQPKDAPSPTVLGIPAWGLATAGFVSTLAGGLWLRRLV